jgi:hypothetical protein
MVDTPMRLAAQVRMSIWQVEQPFRGARSDPLPSPAEKAMRRIALSLLVLLLTGCGGGKSSTTLTITCADGTEVNGAASVDVLGDLANGRPVINFPDPVNPGKTATISIQPSGHCKIAP